MDAEVKKKWVAALRSGEYKQAKKQLRYDGSFCCLGVLCEISGLTAWGNDSYMDCMSMPPDQVYEFAGVPRDSVGCLKFPKVVIDNELKALDEHNDDGKTFAQIADAIEAQL